MDLIIVKETMTVTRYHLVAGTPQEAIQKVKDCADDAIYLHSCDELDWQGKIKYTTEKLKKDWEKDLRLRGAARQIASENTLTKDPEPPIMSRQSGSVVERLRKIK